MTTSEEFKLQQENAILKQRLKVSAEIDELVEACTVSQKNLALTMTEVFAYIERELQPSRVFLRTMDEELRLATFVHNIDLELLERDHADLFRSDERMTKVFGGEEWFVMNIDVAGENLGSFGMAYPDGWVKDHEVQFELMNMVIEELDNFFHGIQTSRFKYMAIMEIQRGLKSKNLAEAIDRVVNILGDSVPLEDLALLYLDEDMNGKETVQYVIYRQMLKVYDSVEKPMPELERLLESGTQIVAAGNLDLARVLSFNGATETILLDGLVHETMVGKVLIRPPEGIGLSMANREICQVFAESLRQRLVDFNREKNNLRQFFSPEVTRQLLRHSDYEPKFLAPRKAEIGILFADLSGFTKMSEQILRDPERIAGFVDAWSRGCVEEVFAEGGALDKLVGDCVIALFGPPFYDRAPGATAVAVLRGAMRIRDFTRKFFERPENADVRAHPLYPDLGVATGINFCSADVGLIGPNHDLTAFSSGMNNTARLQGLAKRDQILLTPSLKALVEKECPGVFTFEGPMAAAVKNVKEPLQYFELTGGR